MPSGVAVKALKVFVPNTGLLELAKKFQNKDFLATYSRKVVYNSAMNLTTLQVMRLVLGLDGTFSKLKGMENVGKEVSDTLKPLIMLPPDPNTSDKSDAKLLCAFFDVSPNAINILYTSDDKIRDSMSESARQTVEKYKKASEISNYHTIYYLLTVLAVYYPGRKTFEVYYAYVHCGDTSVWQWMLTGNQKKRRMASLELQGFNLLGRTIAQHSDDIEVVEGEDSKFSEQCAALT